MVRTHSYPLNKYRNEVSMFIETENYKEGMKDCLRLNEFYLSFGHMFTLLTEAGS